MTPYDVAMGAAIVAGMVWGAWRGITWQLASILSLGLGYAVAVPTSAQLAQHFPGQPIVARALAMLTLYLAVSAGVFAVAWSIRATLRKWKFEAYDRHLGMLLGGMEGAMLGVVVTVFVVSLAPQSRTPILTSVSGRTINRVLRVAEPALPAEVGNVLKPFWAALDGNAPAEAAAEPAPVMADQMATEVPAQGAPKVDEGVLRSAFKTGADEVGRAIADEFRGGLGGGTSR